MTDAGDKPVGWRYRYSDEHGTGCWHYAGSKPSHVNRGSNGYEEQPLYTRPATDNAPAVSEAKGALNYRDWRALLRKVDWDEIRQSVEGSCDEPDADLQWAVDIVHDELVGQLAALSQPTRTEAEASTERGELVGGKLASPPEGFDVEEIKPSQAEIAEATEKLTRQLQEHQQLDKLVAEMGFQTPLEAISALRNHEGPRTEGNKELVKELRQYSDALLKDATEKPDSVPHTARRIAGLLDRAGKALFTRTEADIRAEAWEEAALKLDQIECLDGSLRTLAFLEKCKSAIRALKQKDE